MGTPSRERSVSRVMRAHHALSREAVAREGEINHASLAVRADPEFDDIGDEFFAKSKTAAEILNDADSKALDAMLERVGLRNVLLSLVGLLESRVEDGVFRADTLILHLSRHDRYAAAAEMLQNLAFNKAFDL